MTVAFGLSLMRAGESAGASPEGARVPVLLELFTSEGCSSCPPADKLLETLDHSQPVAGADLIVLSEHVDYWNEGGWADPYSSAANTARQRDYVKRFNLDNSYTPQLVVDGQSELVGSDASGTKRAITKAIRDPKLMVTLSSPERDGNRLKIHVEVAASGESAKSGASVFVALADNHDQSHVAGGENGGRTLTHVAVLRALGSVGTMSAGQQFAKDVVLPLRAVGPSGFRVVTFVQDNATGRIIGVAQQRVAKL